jgi:hypothetical protein
VRFLFVFVEAEAQGSAEEIAAAIQAVLAEPSYRESADRLATAIDATVTDGLALRELEALGQTATR